MDAGWGWSILFALAAAVPPTMIGLTSGLGWWWVIVSPLPLIVWNVAWIIMGNSPRAWRVSVSAAIAVGSLSVIALGVHGLMNNAYAQTPPSVNGNCNNFGSNNVNCNTLNLGPQRLQLTDSVKSDILAHIPKDKPGIVNITGPAISDLQVGRQIIAFMKENGYNVREGQTSMYVAPAPEHKLTLTNTPNSPTWVLDVAPDAQ